MNDLSRRPEPPNSEAKKPDSGQDLPQVVACAAEDSVDRILLHALQKVPSEKSIRFHVADLGFHSGSAQEVAFEGVAKFAGAADKHSASSF